MTSRGSWRKPSRAFGRLDVLVNNAALRAETPFAELTLAQWHNVLGIVLDGAFLCSQAALPHLRASGRGAIVNVGGLTAHTGAKNRAHVVTAKAGLAGFTRALAHELSPEGITGELRRARIDCDEARGRAAEPP